jgi:DNA polymerase-4
MPVAEAHRLCPNGIYIWGRHDRYHEFSEKVMDIFYRYTPLVEPLSLDEAFLDVTGSLSLFGKPEDIAKRIKKEVKDETGLTISAGIATQKHIAKIASGLNKPDALNYISEGKELEFLWPLDLKKLWGVGKVTLAKLNNIGLKTIGDLAIMPEEKLSGFFGDSGKHLWELANAIDDREVIPDHEAKSIGAEETYYEDISGEEVVMRELLSLSFKVSERLRKAGFMGYTLTVKLRDSKFKTITRSKTQDEPLNDHKALYSLAKSLIPPDNYGPFRLLGIQVSGLIYEEEACLAPPKPKPLFDLGEPILPHVDKRLTAAMDLINDKFGKKTVAPATLLEKPRHKKENPKNDIP